MKSFSRLMVAFSLPRCSAARPLPRGSACARPGTVTTRSDPQQRVGIGVGLGRTPIDASGLEREAWKSPVRDWPHAEHPAKNDLAKAVMADCTRGSSKCAHDAADGRWGS